MVWPPAVPNRPAEEVFAHTMRSLLSMAAVRVECFPVLDFFALREFQAIAERAWMVAALYGVYLCGVLWQLLQLASDATASGNAASENMHTHVTCISGFTKEYATV